VHILTARDKQWICDAALVRKIDYLPASRMEEAQQKRLTGQQLRLQKKLNEVEARSRLAITHESNLDEVEALNHTASAALEERIDHPLFDGITIDVLDTNY
jgi:hypothetical protein